VGRAFGLPPDRAERLVVGNLLGLLALHLEDAARDGELPPSELGAAGRLSKALLDEALATYAAEVPARSALWGFVDDALDRWRCAQATAAPARRASADAILQADRAIPIRVAAFAVCLLTDRWARWPRLDACLDHALAALVRYDQLLDWEDDLAAGRWNSFVAQWTSAPQDAAHRERNRAATQVALLARRASAAEYRAIAADARTAAAMARDLEIEPLGTFLDDYAARTEDQGAQVQAHYDGVADRAVELLFSGRGMR
jgi:hypothetical protein